MKAIADAEAVHVERNRLLRHIIKLANGSRISFSEEPLDDTYKYQSSGGLIYFEIGIDEE